MLFFVKLINITYHNVSWYGNGSAWKNDISTLRYIKWSTRKLGGSRWNKVHRGLRQLIIAWEVWMHWLRICKAFRCAREFFLFMKKLFWLKLLEKTPKFKYFIKFSTNLNVYYFEEKNFNFSLNLKKNCHYC